MLDRLLYEVPNIGKCGDIVEARINFFLCQTEDGCVHVNIFPPGKFWVEARTQFFILMCLTAVFMPLSSPNVIATVYDVTVPEVRSTAQAVEYFVENFGAAAAPAIAGAIATAFDLKTAILWICISTWILCFFFYLGALFTIDHDVHSLRAQMQARADAMK